jgi:RNA polymerase sigma-70 factor (ECF subfamily)
MARKAYAQLADDELIRLCKARDEDAFAALVERYKARVYALAYRMVGRHEEAEDIAQEAFINVYRAIDSFRLGDKFSSWVYRITSNLAIDYLRKRKLRAISVDSPKGPDNDVYIQLPDKGDGPEAKIIQAELKAAIEKAIEGLSPSYKAVVVLRHVNNLSYDEIASVLGIPLGTVKTRLFRAREILRARVQAEYRLDADMAGEAQR